MSDVVAAKSAGADMLVTVTEYDAETWVHVSSDIVWDWPSVRATLPPELRSGLTGQPAYFPANPVKGQAFGDWWVFGTPGTRADWEG